MHTSQVRAETVDRALRQLSDPQRAIGLQRFFRTGPGEYGEGDRFLGLYVPQVREVVAKFPDLPLSEIEKLLASPWHETRLTGVMLLSRAYKRGDARVQHRVYDLYLRSAKRGGVNNWDLVDVSAPNIVGAHLLPRSRAPLRRLARSTNLWERRIAIVATQYLIAHRDFDDTLRIAEMLFADEHDLIHKATGWMLREVGKRDVRVLLSFLDKHAAAMPRTALRYSLERLTPAQRGKYMAVPRRPTSGRR